jgi:glyoxylase-like metal-dependent hydrolase (beta-lactamase superfamily II)
VNSYVIIGEERNLVVDTGMNRSECLEVLDRELSMLEIDLSVTDVFVTHLHADHLGLAPYISKGRNKVYLGKEDIEAIEESDYWKKMHSFAVKNGFPGQDPEDSIKKHPGYKYGPLGPMDLHPVFGGEDFHIGSYDLKAVHTPGHSDGHMCLYDEKNKVLFSGDHILGDITPNISLWDGEGDPLSDFIKSLEMVKGLDVDITLPGHRSLIKDHVKRIDELIHHHLQRADEVLDIMGEGSMTGFEIASQMTWDLTIKKFEDFPIMQKWFALGEALAHIRFLEHEGRISREMSHGVHNYSII